MTLSVQKSLAELVKTWPAMSLDDRLLTIDQLRHYGDEAIATSLSAYAKDANPVIRLTIPWILAYLERSRGILAAIDALQDPEALVRELAAGLLHDYPDPISVPALIQAIKVDVGDEVRAIACAALESIGDERALPALEWVAQHDHGRDYQGTRVSTYARVAIEKIRENKPGQFTGAPRSSE